ncbi:MAG: DUF1489 family protein, partial [Magnetospiraceae bacterium]
KRLCVGVEVPEQLAAFQAQRLATEGRLYTWTRMTPKRADALLAGGSLYWVMKGRFRVRQAITGIETEMDPEGRKICRIGLGPDLIPVRQQPQNAFQGWRYLQPEDAPADEGGSGAGEDLPEALRAELQALGLL